jgi:GAF domain-containing protein
MDYTASAAEFARLTRELASCADLDSTLQAVVEAAVRIDGAEHAAITTRNRQGRFQTVASTSEIPLMVDAIQYRTLEGPCVGVIDGPHVFRTDDLAGDDRWPVFGRLAAESTPIVSMLSYRLYLDDEEALGGLNLYSSRLAAFAEVDLTQMDALAAQCAAAMATAVEREQNEHLQRALESNRQIGVAMGILMHSRKITNENAFGLLRVASQRLHRKLYDVAVTITETGELPPLPPMTIP